MTKSNREFKEPVQEEIGEPVEVEFKRPLDKVLPIRLSANHWAELYRYAHELGVGPTTLARMWILEKLAFIRATASDAYAYTRVPSVPNWPQLTPQHLTFDEYMEKLDSVVPDDLKTKIIELGKQSIIPENAENWDDVKAFFMTMGPDSESWQLIKELYGCIAKLSGIEIIKENVKVQKSKLEK